MFQPSRHFLQGPAIAPDLWASRRMDRPSPRSAAQWKESRFHGQWRDGVREPFLNATLIASDQTATAAGTAASRRLIRPISARYPGRLSLQVSERIVNVRRRGSILSPSREGPSENLTWRIQQ